MNNNDDADNIFREKINNSQILKQLAGFGENKEVPKNAAVGHLLGIILGGLVHGGCIEEDALRFIQSELKEPGEGQWPASITQDLLNKILKLLPDYLKDRASAADSVIDYSVNPDGELIVKPRDQDADREHANGAGPSHYGSNLTQ